MSEDKEKYINEVKTITEGIEVYALSAITDEGMESLEPYLKPGNTIVLLGSSGVRKSTLLNSIANEEVMKTSGIREADERGRYGS